MEWMPRSYEDLVPLLDRAIAAVDAEPLRLDALQILEALSGDAPGDGAADACRLFARTGRVPPGLPDWTRWQVSCRLRCARWYCGDLADPSWDDGSTAGECLESLLIEYWDDVGRFDWIQEDVLAGDYTQPDG